MPNENIASAYLRAVEKFVADMEQISDTSERASAKMKEAMQDICDLLKISGVEYKLIASPLVPRNSAAGGRQAVFYDTGKTDFDRSFKFTRVTGEGNTLEYSVYPFSGYPDWSDKEKEHINSFITMLFIFNSRTRVMNIAERFKFRDEEFLMYNLNYFMREIAILLQQQKAIGYTCCRFNVKGMSVINRQFGMETGSTIMRKFAKGLENLFDEDGLVCRIGGDNFIAKFRNGDMEKAIDYLDGTIIETGVEGRETVKVQASAGYYTISENCKTHHDLMERLGVAFEGARQLKGSMHLVYDDKVKQINESRKWVESQFKTALDNEEFLVYYQPKVNINDNTLCGAEALCRWKHNGELIPPIKFIPVLERNAGICTLDYYMLEHVCQDIKRWLENGMKVVRVSVNMSRVHLENENFLDDIFKIVDKYDVPHEYLEFELTETTTDVDFKELKKVVERVKAAGYYTAVDDFGTGYSSLNLISDLPWNVLKIDRSFLPNDNDERHDSKYIMLKHVLEMAKALDLECVVEGAETKEHIELLRKDECEKVQGFFFDKPLPKEEFEQRLLNPVYT